jgi:hypothetical protein
LDTSPNVFICHASEDKSRFVIPFATALRAKGVEAWVDQFEIHSGDSLVAKIFNEGIEKASAIIAVISPASVSKPWVQAEIDVAFVRRIEGKCKLIPIVLDDAKVPTALTAIRWETISDTTNFEGVLHNILLSVFNQYEKPPVGQPPSFVTQKVAGIPNLSHIDSQVLIGCCEASVKEDKLLLEASSLLELEQKTGISDDALCQSLDILHQQGFIEVEKIDNGNVTGCTPRVAGFDLFLRATDPQYTNHFMQVIARMVNSGDVDGKSMMDATGLPARVIYHFVKYLSLQGHLTFLDFNQYGCAQFKVTSVNSTLRRILENAR